MQGSTKKGMEKILTTRRGGSYEHWMNNYIERRCWIFDS
jgi:hypothetical protein